LPKIGEELLDLPLEAVDVAAQHMAGAYPRQYHRIMSPARRILKLLGVTLGLGAYVWVAAVRNVGRVKRRKAARRAAAGSGGTNLGR
jgi:hypothetical protein